MSDDMKSKRVLHVPLKEGLLSLVLEKADTDTWTCTLNTETLNDIEAALERNLEWNKSNDTD